MTITIKRGLDIRAGRDPNESIEAGPAIREIALLGRDYVGLKPGLLVGHGETVGLGQPVFTDKSNPEVMFTAPAGGMVTAINRGRRRSLTSLVFDVTAEPGPERTFRTFTDAELRKLDRRVVCDQLLSSGLWTAFRTRPFSRVPRAGSSPQAIFVTAMDTRPLAADPAVIIQSKSGAFNNGLNVIARLTDGPVHVCVQAEAAIELAESNQIRGSRFAGPHPAGLPGTHIHFLHPVSDDRLVWHIGYQDVIALGTLFATGRLDSSRVIALGGPAVERPRLVKAPLGAAIGHLAQQQRGPCRVVSGSVLCGHPASGETAFLGRYHNQVSVLPERRERSLFGWLRRDSAMTTSQHGEPAAMVPLEAFERVMPLDILAASLLRTLLVKDTVNAQRLGCLELDEEDLALCSYLCPAKIDYGAALRANLQKIWLEG